MFHFPGGLKDYLAADIEGKPLVAEQFFTGRIEKPERHGSLEWAVAWLAESPSADELMRGNIDAQDLVIDRGLYPDWRRPESS